MSTVGDILKTQRMSKGLTIEEVEEVLTKRIKND